jgi:hypothetical protein
MPQTLLKQAESTRDLARRARKLAEELTAEPDRQRLRRHAEDLEAQAAELERRASMQRAQ